MARAREGLHRGWVFGLRRYSLAPACKTWPLNIEWGGQGYSLPEVKSPPMGCGEFPDSDIKMSASCQDIITEAHDKVPAADTEAYSDRDKYHWAMDRGYVKGRLRHVRFYGEARLGLVKSENLRFPFFFGPII